MIWDSTKKTDKEDVPKLVRHIQRYPEEEPPVVPLISEKEEAGRATVNKPERTPTLVQVGRLTWHRAGAVPGAGCGATLARSCFASGATNGSGRPFSD